MARKFGGTVKKTDTVLVTSVDLASADVTGVLPVANGGTGSGSYTDGQLLIGNTSGNTLTKATLTAGSGISITNGGGSITIASSGGGLTNWSESAGTYSSKDWKRFYPVSGTNVNVVFSPLGTGSIQAQVADGTSTGGNQRGDRAVDWQFQRASANQVASAANSTISGGYGNRASQQFATVAGGKVNLASNYWSIVAGGLYNTASGAAGFVGGGQSNTASGSRAVVAGGTGCTANASYASVLGGTSCNALASCATALGGKGVQANGAYSVAGGYASTARSIHGANVFASGKFGTTGDAQERRMVLRKSSTSATPVVLTSDAGAASTTNQIILPNNSCFMIRGMSACLRTDVAGDRAEYEWSCGIYRGANAASTVIDYSNVDVRYEGDAAFDFTLAADTTNGGLTISFVGASGKTVRAVTTAWCCEVTA